MQIKKYTIELNWDEMYDLAHALEHYIQSTATNSILDDYTEELKLLQTFVGSYGYQLTVSKRTKEGHIEWEHNAKIYNDAEEWFKAQVAVDNPKPKKK